MVVSPRSSHPFGISVVWHDVVIVGELFVADCAYSFLLGDFPLQKFAHFGWGIGVLISPRMMGIFNPLNSTPNPSGFPKKRSVAAGERSMD